MNSLPTPRLGFRVPACNDARGDAKLGARILRTGIAAAHRKFTPEFINRLDKIVVFKSFGIQELHRIVDIELEMVYHRFKAAVPGKRFLINVTDSAREMLLREGIDPRYGARPLKRAIKRLLVHPISNLLASGQICQGDCIRVIASEGSSTLTFMREWDTPQCSEFATQAA
jgi:ATP-dependent Clp protease ATP-binding subunit ClpA